MKTFHIPALFGVALAISFFAAASFAAAGATAEESGAQVGPERLETMAREFVSTWSQGDHEGASATFDETMKRMMPPEKMREAWEALIGRVGAFEEQIGTRTEKWNEHDIVYVTCRFASSPIDIKVVYDGGQRIAGLWFVPTERPAAEYEPPPYAEHSAFREEEIRVGAGEWELPGTLSLPTGEGPFPVVVLVHGSGPNDRDETVGPNKPFRDLAWGLATNGIAVLRYDKRTKVHGARMIELEGGITIREETVDDAVTAVRLLRNDSRIDGERIFVLGHSLGGYCIPMIGRDDPDIAGLVIMAGAARPLEDLLEEQYTYIFSLDGVISDEERSELEKIEKQVAAVKDPNLSPDTPRESLPLGSSAAYWLGLRGYRPTEMIAHLGHPFLVLHAERDYQVTMTDFEKWRAALTSHHDVTFKSYPPLNHLFITGEGRCTPAEYQQAGHVAEEVVNDIAEWIARH